MNVSLSLLGVICFLFWVKNGMELQIKKYLASKIVYKKLKAKVIEIQDIKPYKKVYLEFKFWNIPIRVHTIPLNAEGYVKGQEVERFVQFYFPEADQMVLC